MDMEALLKRLENSESGERQRAWSELYGEMLRLARAQRRRWEGNWTLETRALANEAYLKLFGAGPRTYADAGHFFRVVSRAIRQVLVNYSEAQSAAKRGGTEPDATLNEAVDLSSVTPAAAEEILELHQALERFQELDPRAAEVVELRYFAGLTHEEIAETLGVSLATVGRDWTAARAWLSRELAEGV